MTDFEPTEVIARELVDALHVLHEPAELSVWVWIAGDWVHARIRTEGDEITMTRGRPPLKSKREALDLAHALIPLAINILTGEF